MTISGSINHFGMAVPSIADFLEKNSVLYSKFKHGQIIVNETQNVREMFITDGCHVIELLEPLAENSPLDGFLAKKSSGGLIHIALDVRCLDEAIADVKSQGGRLIMNPTPDIAFDYRRIAFVHLDGQITELIEMPQPKD